MSHARKHLKDEMDEDVELTEGRDVVRMTEPRGTNIVEVEAAPGGERTLCMSPRRFNKLVWVKRGDMLLVERIAEDARPDKVRAMLVRPIPPAQRRRLRKLGQWPAVWDDGEAAARARSLYPGSESDSDADPLPQNANRRHLAVADETSSDDDDDSSDDDDE